MILSLAIHVLPPSVDLSNTNPSGPAQVTYISPLGPTAGTAPSTVLSSSTQSPPRWSSRTGLLQLVPPSTDFEKRIWLLSVLAVLPYLSNWVQVMYILLFLRSTIPHCLSCAFVPFN